jgi:hypothetical protein
MAKQATKTNNAPQPLFFKTPAPVMKDKHAEAGLSTKVDYAFSKATNSVPITTREFAEICKTYPIVFPGGASNDAVAVLGIENTKNLFVSAEGNWQKDVYIPAYVRKYPFAFMSAGKGADEKLILCVDESSGRFAKKAKKTDLKFFDEGNQTASTKNALEYCLQYHRDSISTQEFVKEIKAAGLLIQKQITATFKNKPKPISLSGLFIVDENKLQGLDSAKIAEWHKKGYLALVYMHLISLSNFNRLSNLIK